MQSTKRQNIIFDICSYLNLLNIIASVFNHISWKLFGDVYTIFFFLKSPSCINLLA